MKYFIFLFLFQTLIFADYPVMLEIQSEVKVPNDFRDGVEEILTSLEYSLVDKKAQDEALKNQVEQRNSECYDDACLVDTGKMLAAKALIIVNIEKKGEDSYKFKARVVDFEKGTTTKTVSRYFEYRLTNYKELMKFGKLLTKSLFKKSEEKVKEKANENVENDILKEEIRILKNKFQKIRINPRKKYKKTIFVNGIAPTILALGASYRFTPRFELSFNVGILSGLGIAYHFFTDTTLGSSGYMGADYTYNLFIENDDVGIFYPHIGYQYISQDGFYFSINVGAMFPVGDDNSSDIIPMGGLKLGYSF